MQLAKPDASDCDASECNEPTHRTSFARLRIGNRIEPSREVLIARADTEEKISKIVDVLERDLPSLRNADSDGEKMNRSIWNVLAAAMLISMQMNAFADGSSGELVAKGFNSGFIQNPPAAIKKRFPMCEQFLKVDWLDRKRKIGYSAYELFVLDGGDKSKVNKVRVAALVDLDSERFDYDASGYEEETQRKELFQAIRNGKIHVRDTIEIDYKGKSYTFHAGIYPQRLNPTFGENRSTVCMVHPYAKRAWIVEGKAVKYAYDEMQRDELLVKVVQLDSSATKKWFESLWVLDINFDGSDDFFAPRSFIYSRSGALYQMSQVLTPGASSYRLSFPPSGRTCEIPAPWGYPLLTDGTSYYLTKSCNLTKLTGG